MPRGSKSAVAEAPVETGEDNIMAEDNFVEDGEAPVKKERKKYERKDPTSQAQAALERAQKRLDKALERQAGIGDKVAAAQAAAQAMVEKAQNGVTEAQAEVDEAQAERDYAASHWRLQSSAQPELPLDGEGTPLES